MKRIVTFIMILIACAASFGMQAQDKKKNGKSHSEMRKELREYKLKYLTQEMDLNEETKAKFAEIFEENFEAQAKLFREVHSAKKELDSKANPSEEDFQEFRKIQASVKQKEQLLDSKYKAKLEKILTAKQLYKLQEGEEKFRNKMHELRAKKEEKNKKRERNKK